MHDKFRMLLLWKHPCSLALYPGTMERELFLETNNSHAQGYTCIMNIKSNDFKGKMILDLKEFSRGKKESDMTASWKAEEESPSVSVCTRYPCHLAVFFSPRSKRHYIWQKLPESFQTADWASHRPELIPQRDLQTWLPPDYLRPKVQGWYRVQQKRKGSRSTALWKRVLSLSLASHDPAAGLWTNSEPLGSWVTLEAKRTEMLTHFRGGWERLPKRSRIITGKEAKPGFHDPGLGSPELLTWYSFVFPAAGRPVTEEFHWSCSTFVHRKIPKLKVWDNTHSLKKILKKVW